MTTSTTSLRVPGALSLLTLAALGCNPDAGLKAFNAEPEAEITSHADDAEVREGETESFRGSVTDPDHDSSNLVAIWYLGGEEVCSAATPGDDGVTTCDILISAETDEVVLEVRDPQNAAGSDVLSLSVVPGNTSPTVDTPTLSPSTAYTNDTLTASVTPSDDDGDSLTVTYTWYVDDEQVQEGADNTLDGVSFFDKNQAVHVVVTADDGQDTAAVSSDPLTVSNTPPTAPEIGIASMSTVGDDVVCEVTADGTDVDGDLLSYRMSWTVDGEEYTGATVGVWPGDTVNGADAMLGQEWECLATPEDGDDDGDTASASVVIGDFDGDGYSVGEDCDDTDPTVHPLAGDTYGDGEDSDCDDLDCEADWSGSAYLASCRGSVTWSQARDICQDAGHDSLATIDSAAEQTLMVSLMDASGSWFTWIGLNDLAVDGTFEWDDGTAVSYTNWNSGEPSGDNGDGGTEDCVLIQSNLGSHWNDGVCSLTTLDGYACSTR